MSWVGLRFGRFDTLLFSVVSGCASLAGGRSRRECPESRARRRVPARERPAPDRCCAAVPSRTHGVTALVADNVATPRAAPSIPRKRDDALDVGVADHGVIDRRRTEASLSVAVSRRSRWRRAARGGGIAGDRGSASEIFSRTSEGGPREAAGRGQRAGGYGEIAERIRTDGPRASRPRFIATERPSRVPGPIHRSPSKHRAARENIVSTSCHLPPLLLPLFLSLTITA